MSFRDSLKAFIQPEKLTDAEKVFDKLYEQLDGYAADIRTLKQSLREKDGIKPEDFAKLEKERDDLLKANSESERARKKAETDLQKAGETAAQFRERTHKLMKDDGLRKALIDAGVKKEYLDAAHALLLRDIQVDDEKGEAFAVLVKDGKESRAAIADHVKAWGASETGKAFIAVPASSGGGAQGSGSGGTGAKLTRDQTFMEIRSKQGLEAANRWAIANPAEATQ